MTSNNKRRFMKKIGEHHAFYADATMRYTNLLPSLALVHDGQVLPIGVSLRFLWFSIALVRVD